MKNQVFLIPWPDWSGNSNVILGVIFPPKMGPGSKDSNYYRVSNEHMKNYAPAFLSQSGGRPALSDPYFYAPASHQDDGSMDKPNSL